MNIINQSDVEVHDLDGLGIGIANQEAMALGKPVIVGAREDNFGPGILKNWENIIIVPPGDHITLADAILKLMRNSEVGRAVGKRASETIAKHFTWAINVQKTIELYQKLVTSGVSSQTDF